jgi:hypothetical protein
MIIRLSQLTALEVLQEDFARDLDQSPKVHLYEYSSGARVDKLVLQEDVAPLQQMTRQNSLATFWGGVLLGTSNFYPEQALGLTSYHALSELHEVINAVTLPTIEWKKLRLLFSQGMLADQSVKGHWIRIYCQLPNGHQVNLASVVDFMNSSNIKAVPAKLFESQQFNEALDLEIIDVEFLLSSTTPEIVQVKEALFGNWRPTELFVEYSVVREENIDEFTEASLLFTRLNFSVINQQSMPITFEQSEMFAKLELTQDSYAIGSRMTHQKYNVEQYLNTLKEPEDTYKVEHQFNLNAYDSGNQLLQNLTFTAYDPVNKFEQIIWRPLVDPISDHFVVESTIRIENVRTGLTFRRSASIIVTSDNVHKFKAQATVQLEGLAHTVVENIVQKEVKQIVMTPEIPKIVQLERRLYVQVQQLQEIELFDTEQIIDLTLSTEITGYNKLFLKIDNLLIPNEPGYLTRFRLPAIAYSARAAKWQLLDSQTLLISSGILKRA